MSWPDSRLGKGDVSDPVIRISPATVPIVRELGAPYVILIVGGGIGGGIGIDGSVGSFGQHPTGGGF